MKKKSLVGLLAILTFGVLLVGGYYWGTDFASDQIADKVTGELEESGKLEELKDTIEKDPEVQKFLEQQEPVADSGQSNQVAAAGPVPAEPADNGQAQTGQKQTGQSDTAPADKADGKQAPKQGTQAPAKEDLPFTTKEEATRVLIKKVGVPRIQEIHKEVSEGTADQEEIMKEMESKLTEEEIQALKVIAYEELSKKQGE